MRCARPRSVRSLICTISYRIVACPDDSRNATGPSARRRCGSRTCRGAARSGSPSSTRTSTTWGCRTSGFQCVFEMLNAHARRPVRARVPARRHPHRGARAHGQPPRDPRLRRRRCATSTWSRSRSASRTTTCTSSRCCASPASPSARRTADRRDPLVVLGGAAALPEPRAARPLRRPHRGGRGRGPRAEDDGRPPRRRDAARRASSSSSRRTASTSPRATRCATTPTAPWPPTTARARVIRQRGWPGKMPHAAVGDPHPAHRDVHEVHGGDLARLPVHVPLLLGGLQLPARARLLAAGDRGPRPRGAEGRGQDRPRLHRGVRPPGDRRHRGRPRGAWTTRSRWPRSASTTSPPSSSSSSPTPASRA